MESSGTSRLPPLVSTMVSMIFFEPQAAAYLAGVQHLGDSATTEVGRGDDVLLAAGVAGGHSLGRGHGDTFRRADELLWRGGLQRRVRAAEHLTRQTTKHH